MIKTSAKRVFRDVAFLTMALTFAPTVTAESIVVTKLKLQAAMQSYIEEKLVDGSFLYLDPETGVVAKARPSSAHPTILAIKNGNILCADFRTIDGKTINVDFFVAKVGGEFTVYSHAIEHRSRVKDLMEAGLAKKM